MCGENRQYSIRRLADSEKSSKFGGFRCASMGRRFMTLVVFVSAVVLSAAASRTWEEVDRLPVSAVEMRVDAPEEPYTMVSDGYVYVAVRQRTTVKVFTILGQLVVQDDLRPGIYRYKLNSRGIYLLKVGSVTRRVTI